jgi:hypothetical protein
MDIHQLRHLLVSQEPDGIAPYIATPRDGQPYHYGTTAKIIGGFTRHPSGMWIPANAKVDASPIDLMRTYITLSQISDGRRISAGFIERILRGVNMKSALLAVTACMRIIQVQGEQGRQKLDQDSLVYFAEPYRSRLTNLMRAGSVLHAPQLLMIMEKLIIGICPDEVDEEDQRSAALPVLLLILADLIDTGTEHVEPIPMLGTMSLELSANHMFNADVEPDLMMASFQRRWVEVPAERPSRHSPTPLIDTYLDVTGVSLLDLATVMTVIFANCMQGHNVANVKETFNALGWESERIEKVLFLIALPASTYRTEVARELAEHRVDWYFTTFARYPLVRFGDELLLLDPDLLLRRCLGYLPFFDVQETLIIDERKSEFSVFQRAFNDYSERVALESVQSMAGKGGRRVFDEKALQSAYPGKKTADFAVDYGDAWLVVEVTTSQAQRDTVNAVSTTGLEKDRDLVIAEAKQISATIDSLREHPEKLGVSSVPNRRFFPIVLLTEGFPNHPMMQTLVREELRSQGILTNADTAPLELVGQNELDLIEGVVEHSRTTLPHILTEKAKSNFWADSIRNFLVSDSRFTAKRSTRVDLTLGRFFQAIGKHFGVASEQQANANPRGID